MILGQEQDSLGSEFSSLESFWGQMTRFEFWSRGHMSSNMDVHEAMTDCTGKSMRGDVFTWTDGKNGVRGFVEVL